MKQLIQFKSQGLVLLLGLLFSSCVQDKNTPHGELDDRLRLLQGRTMGTTYNIKYIEPPEAPTASELQKQIDLRLKNFNQDLSTYIEDSEISQFNNFRSKAWFDVSPDFAEALNSAQSIYQKSEGGFDPSVMPLVNLWGFGPDGPQEVPTDKVLNEVLSYTGFNNIEFDRRGSKVRKKNESVELDFSASAKGLGVDRVAELLEGLKVNNFMVEIGGEVRVAGNKAEAGPWVMAIESPQKGSRRIGQKVIVLDQDYALATSGSYRNFFEKEDKLYQHTLNPKTGRPVQSDVVSVSVIDLDKSCQRADAWATALMVVGFEKARKLSVDFNLAVYMIYQMGQDEREFIEYESPRFKKLMNDSPLED